MKYKVEMEIELDLRLEEVADALKEMLFSERLKNIKVEEIK